MNNAARYGFRYHSTMVGNSAGVKVSPEPALFASAYQPAVNGSGNCNIGIGDPITGLATGMCQLAAGIEAAAGAAEAIKGVIYQCLPQWSATQSAMVPGNVIQGGIVYGTNLERQTKALYVPVRDTVFEADVVNAGASFDTVAEFQAAYGANADHRNVFDATSLRAVPQVDLATVAATTAQWRIIGLSKSALNQDLTGTNAKLLVSCFEEQTAGI
jgi:hypothetical protein